MPIKRPVRSLAGVAPGVHSQTGVQYREVSPVCCVYARIHWYEGVERGTLRLAVSCVTFCEYTRWSLRAVPRADGQWSWLYWNRTIVDRRIFPQTNCFAPQPHKMLYMYKQ